MDSKETIDLGRTIAEATNLLCRFVIPLYAGVKSRPILVGSGFFVEYQGKTALVSARHVLEQFSSSNPILVYRKVNQVVAIDGLRYLSNSSSVDLGFVLTKTIALPWPDVDKLAYPLKYLHASRAPRQNKRYLIAGYPETKNRAKLNITNIQAVTYAYHAHSISDSEYQSLGIHSTQHIALPLDLRAGFDPDGRLVNFPKPQGMSGSPIWELFDESEANSKTRGFPLVGVATTYSKAKKTVFGSDVSPLLQKLTEVLC
ncbi:MAG: hypothetical protein AAF290_08285 [Pseudomonadota bacterium]